MQGALLVAAGAVAILAYFWGNRQRRFNEDRPDIRVRNAKLRFENDKDWKDASGAGRRWKLDHAQGKSIKKFIVASCGLAGTEVRLTFRQSDGTNREFLITLEENSSKIFEPVLESLTVDLDYDGTRKKLKIKADNEGELTSVLVDKRACQISQPTGSIRIDIEMCG